MGNVLVLYTGGTFGMVLSDPANPQSSLIPAHWDDVLTAAPHLPPLLEEATVLEASFGVIDSSDIKPAHWIEIAGLIREAYDAYDGFIVLHGTDTMAYTASALSFLFHHLAKPVVLTGATKPAWHPETDALDNLRIALQVASPAVNAMPCIPEVVICFGKMLLRGNRTRKLFLEGPQAFLSPNYDPLGTFVTHPCVHQSLLRKSATDPFSAQDTLDPRVLLLDVFPGLEPAYLDLILTLPELRGIIMRTYGSGNAPTTPEFLTAIEQAVGRGIVVVNCSQCMAGSVAMEQYAAGNALRQCGVTRGGDMTPEAALTKLQVLLAAESDPERIRILMETDLRGELTEYPFR